jgi:hypothetical protein
MLHYHSSLTATIPSERSAELNKVKTINETAEVATDVCQIK